MSEDKKNHHTGVSAAVKGFAGSIGGVAEVLKEVYECGSMQDMGKLEKVSEPAGSDVIAKQLNIACALQPMDVIKTRIQLDRTGKYKGIINTGKTIYAEEGLRALWKGLTPFATHLTLKYALRMGSNSVYQNLLRDQDGKLTSGRRMAAGFMAGITEALIIVTPFEVVKIRLQQQKGLSKEQMKYKGPIHCALTTLREEGIRGLWSGAAPTVLRNGTNQMCLFWAKHNMDSMLWDKHEGDGKHLTVGQSMSSGFLAACLGPIATGPFDVVKTRLMAQTSNSEGGIKYKGFLDALVKIPREEGLAAMWKGILPRLLRIPPGQAIVWAVSDQITGYVERANAAAAAGTAVGATPSVAAQ